MKRAVMGGILGLSLAFGWLALAAQPVRGVAQSDSVTSVDCRDTQFLALPDPVVTLTTQGNLVLVSFMVRTIASANTTFHYYLAIDGQVQAQQISASSHGAGNELVHTFILAYALPTGTHTFSLAMACSGVVASEERWLTVSELNGSIGVISVGNNNTVTGNVGALITPPAAP
jgi:hypothetical protein